MRGRSTWDWNTGEPTVCMTKADIARYAKEATARTKRKSNQTAALIAPSQPVIAYSKAKPGTMTDAERELHIKSCGELMQAAHKRGDVDEARQWLDTQNKAILTRSDKQVARMEACYFSDMGEKDKEVLSGASR